MIGVVNRGQTADAVLVTLFNMHSLLPMVVTVLPIEHALIGVTKLALKLVVIPGARLAMESTVLGVDWTSTTVTFVRAILPELLTVPVNVTKPPARTGPAGGVRVIAMAEAVVMGQVIVAIFVTVFPVQKSMPVAVEMLAEEQLLGAR